MMVEIELIEESRDYNTFKISPQIKYTLGMAKMQEWSSFILEAPLLFTTSFITILNDPKLSFPMQPCYPFFKDLFLFLMERLLVRNDSFLCQ
jgi:hypothetical protein